MIYVMIADGFEEIEALEPVDIMRRAGLSVQTVGVSGLAFDGNRGRMGYGAGYYDRFLAAADAVSCMPAFSLQRVECAAFETTDIAVDMIVTEGEIIL